MTSTIVVHLEVFQGRCGVVIAFCGYPFHAWRIVFHGCFGHTLVGVVVGFQMGPGGASLQRRRW